MDITHMEMNRLASVIRYTSQQFACPPPEVLTEAVNYLTLPVRTKERDRRIMLSSYDKKGKLMVQPAAPVYSTREWSA